MGTWHILLCASLQFSVVTARAQISEFANPTVAKQTVESCQQFLESGKCDQFKGQPGALKVSQCQAEVNGDNWSVLSRLANCGSGFKFSAVTLWENVKSVGSSTISAAGGIYSYLTDSNTRAATHESLQEALKVSGEYLESVYPYIATEFTKALDEANKNGGNPSVNAFNVANQLAPQLMGKMMSAALEIIKAKYEEFHCFDNNKQVEMVCKVAVDLFVPPVAIFKLYKAGVKGLAALPKVTEKIEEFLKKGESLQDRAQKIEDAKENIGKVQDKAAEALQKFRESAQASRGMHLVDIKNGEATWKVGYLSRDEMREAGKLIKAGAIQRIDAGPVLGPKVLPTMFDLGKKLPSDAPAIKISGRMNVSRIRKQFEDELKAKVAPISDKGKSNPVYWTQKEVDNYKRAYSDMKIDEACKKYYSNSLCGELLFEFDTKSPDRVRWSRP